MKHRYRYVNVTAILTIENGYIPPPKINIGINDAVLEFVYDGVYEEPDTLG